MDDLTSKQILNHIEKALDAWHTDRLEWADRTFRSLSIVNAGGAVAAATLIGSASAHGPLAHAALESFVLFLIGLALTLSYATYRFLWAEYRISYLRRWRSKIRDYRKHLAALQANPRLKTQRPPTRPQIWLTYILNIGSLICFYVGVGLGVWAVAHIGG